LVTDKTFLTIALHLTAQISELFSSLRGGGGGRRAEIKKAALSKTKTTVRIIDVSMSDGGLSAKK